MLNGIAISIFNLHDKNYIHRDIKPENILVEKFFTPYLGDYGFTKQIEL